MAATMDEPTDSSAGANPILRNITDNTLQRPRASARESKPVDREGMSDIAQPGLGLASLAKAGVAAAQAGVQANAAARKEEASGAQPAAAAAAPADAQPLTNCKTCRAGRGVCRKPGAAGHLPPSEHVQPREYGKKQPKAPVEPKNKKKRPANFAAGPVLQDSFVAAAKAARVAQPRERQPRVARANDAAEAEAAEAEAAAAEAEAAAAAAAAVPVPRPEAAQPQPSLAPPVVSRTGRVRKAVSRWSDNPLSAINLGGKAEMFSAVVSGKVGSEKEFAEEKGRKEKERHAALHKELALQKAQEARARAEEATERRKAAERAAARREREEEYYVEVIAGEAAKSETGFQAAKQEYVESMTAFRNQESLPSYEVVQAEVARAEAIPDEEYFEQEDEVLTGDWLKMLQVKAREQSMVLLMQQQERQRWEERKAVVAGKLAAANAE